MCEPSDGELIGGTFKLVLVDRASGTSKLRLDENTERTFCLNHFFGDRSLFGGVDMMATDKETTPVMDI